MSELPVREMVLYKHGVGFFVREGEMAGENAALTFRHEEINDVLKSLAVFDRAGGQVLGIHYQTPMDRDARLASSSIHLSDDNSLGDLLRDLRGRRATLAFETTPGTIESGVGRVIGVDLNAEDRGQRDSGVNVLAEMLVSLLGDDGQVRVFRLEALRSLQIHDPQSERDLSYFLDTSMSEDNRRIVNVRLSPGDHSLAVYYVAPSPTWRVSYRLVAESEERGESGKGLLQGWGLFDNRLEEDLEDVQVTLVAGQPISFIYDLYASRIPDRPIVQDEARIAPGPVEYQGGGLLGRIDRGVPEGAKARQKRMAAAAPAPAAMMDVLEESGVDSFYDMSLEQATEAVAEGREAGEFFQYVVTTPVSVKRGESALVPIIKSEIHYERELLYNGAKLPKHPVAALRFRNETGLTLERGPVTVVEDGDYRGEAVVPFTKDGGEVYLPYAAELGVQVTERDEHSTQIAGMNVQGGYMVFQEYQVRSVTYVIENTTNRAMTVTIEAPISTGYELFDTPPADVETATVRRWKVGVEAQERATFKRSERSLTRRQQQLQQLRYRDLQRFLANRWLDQATFNQLSEMLDQFQIVQQATERKNELMVERGQVYEQQEQLRKNLGALQPTGQEAALRNRLLGQLESSQDRLDEIEQQIHDLDRQITEAESRANEIIEGLGQQ